MRIAQSPRLFLIALLAVSSFAAFAVRFGVQAQDAKPEDKKDEKKEEGLPLKAEGKISFTTDEGTWMSLDLSPDGQTIVFDLVGDIYTLAINGGEAKKIIGDMSFESQPKFSPDGKQIVFISDRTGGENLYVCQPDGSEIKPITKGRGNDIVSYLSPAWTSDGQYILASKAERGIGAYHVYLYHKDGGSGVSVGPPPPPPAGQGQPGPPAAPPTNKMGAVASPDGRYIYYAQRNGAFNYNVVFPLWQVYRFDRETSETLRVTNAQGSAMRPVLSPDGKHLVYATRYQLQTALRTRDLTTNEERWLISHVTRDDQESRATRDTFPGYAFTADGKSLIVTIDGKIKRVDFATGAATTSTRRPRAHNPSNLPAGMDKSPPLALLRKYVLNGRRRRHLEAPGIPNAGYRPGMTDSRETRRHGEHRTPSSSERADELSLAQPQPPECRLAPGLHARAPR